MRRVIGWNTLFIFAELTANFALQICDFLQTSRVATLFKWCLKPDSNDLIGQLIAELISGEADDVGVVMGAAVFCGDTVVTGRGTDTGEFVGRDAHADSGATDQNAPVDRSGGDFASDLSGIVGVVDALRFKRAKISNLTLETLQELCDAGLE